MFQSPYIPFSHVWNQFPGRAAPFILHLRRKRNGLGQNIAIRLEWRLTSYSKSNQYCRKLFWLFASSAGTNEREVSGKKIVFFLTKNWCYWVMFFTLTWITSDNIKHTFRAVFIVKNDKLQRVVNFVFWRTLFHNQYNNFYKLNCSVLTVID